MDMQFGLMIRGQFDAGDDMHGRFMELLEQVQVINRLGFSSVTMGSHYSQAPLQAFQQLPFLARAA